MRAEAVGRGYYRWGPSASEASGKELDRPPRVIVRRQGCWDRMGKDGVGPDGDKAPMPIPAV